MESERRENICLLRADGPAASTRLRKTIIEIGGKRSLLARQIPNLGDRQQRLTRPLATAATGF